ncbi:LacI family DNA-binding transcriptional regulator [Subtercola boreus]|uniref:LacI family transcriptional regulator n=2 Tax=Subtercola boreus TaxID=120213 RepID=A0A3E0WFU6_9MICO|nr:LacI family DNA-binding transcriptional regulator [Subtercola boreus]RFA23242.1 LacI family transcriptional regulator [Subtercola boreus]RFA23315.1 LacI family transcriptional regulator [Subtercola boreus]RFA29118.1 LacI family transcriptional regulator [Subtercola boreus]
MTSQTELQPAPERLQVTTLQPQSRATLADVGRLAGVSSKTVSRVVLDSGNVSKDTRDKVLAAARSLRFRPNHLARNLRHGSVTNTVAFIIGDLTNPFYFLVAAGIERELARHGLMMILAATDDDPASEERVVQNLLDQRVRALLMVPIAADQGYLEGERQLGTPVVCIDRPARNLIADSVVLGSFEATAEAVRGLIRAGHRRIAFVCSPAALYTHQERLRGYRQALREAGVLDSSPWERLENPGGPTAEESVRDLLAMSEPPTAIIAGNNHASLGVVRALGNHFDRLAFIGFDDFELADALGISVIAYDPAELGRRAAQLVIARLNDLIGPPQQIEIATHLIHRGSGELLVPRDQ